MEYHEHQPRHGRARVDTGQESAVPNPIAADPTPIPIDPFEASRDIAIVLDLDGRIRRVNRAFEQILGYERAEVIKADFMDFIEPEDVDETLETFDKLLKGVSVHQFENRWMAKDGTQKWISWRAAPPDGGFVLGTGRDITHQRKPPSLETSLALVMDRLDTLEIDRHTGQRVLEETSETSKAAVQKVDALDEAERVHRWGSVIGWVAGIVVSLFSLGVAYQLFMGANAMDTEVEARVHELDVSLRDVIKRHNGGVDPHGHNPENGKPYGDHPEMRDAIESNQKAVQQIHEQVAEIEHTTEVLDKRSEYQFELTRWQARVAEAKRRRRKPPGKPKRLEDLERELMGFGD